MRWRGPERGSQTPVAADGRSAIDDQTMRARAHFKREGSSVGVSRIGARRWSSGVEENDRAAHGEPVKAGIGSVRHGALFVVIARQKRRYDSRKNRPSANKLRKRSAVISGRQAG